MYPYDHGCFGGEADMKEIIARPGELIIDTGESVITSYALGSSLGICLYDASHQLGGYVNSLLPINTSNDFDTKYVNSAIHLLYEGMLQRGGDPNQIQAKLIGGAKLFRLPEIEQEEDIGKSNIRSAYHALMKLHVPIISEDVGDCYGRSIHFHLKDGLVYIETRNNYLYHI